MYPELHSARIISLNSIAKTMTLFEDSYVSNNSEELNVT